MSRYNAIGKRLATVDGDTVTITFDEFERWIGGPLPDSARQYSAWWSNSRSDVSHSWANEWLHNGWETTRVNVNDLAITFRRALPDGPAPPSPIPSDFDDSPPGRGVTTAYRILRDSQLARDVKRIHNFECQICRLTIVLPSGTRYAEAHHIQPLGYHHGPDIGENIICVCPNHHAMLDYGVIPLSLRDIALVNQHVIGERFVDYHNQNIHAEGGG